MAAGLDAGAAQRMVDAAGLVVSATCVGLHGGDNSAAYELVAATGAGQIAC